MVLSINIKCFSNKKYKFYIYYLPTYFHFELYLFWSWK